MAILTSLQPWVLLTGLAVDLLAGLQLGVGHLDHTLQGGPSQPDQLDTEDFKIGMEKEIPNLPFLNKI